MAEGQGVSMGAIAALISTSMKEMEARIEQTVSEMINKRDREGEGAPGRPSEEEGDRMENSAEKKRRANGEYLNKKRGESWQNRVWRNQYGLNAKYKHRKNYNKITLKRHEQGKGKKVEVTAARGAGRTAEMKTGALKGRVQKGVKDSLRGKAGKGNGKKGRIGTGEGSELPKKKVQMGKRGEREAGGITRRKACSKKLGRKGRTTGDRKDRRRGSSSSEEDKGSDSEKSNSEVESGSENNGEAQREELAREFKSVLQLAEEGLAATEKGRSKSELKKIVAKYVKKSRLIDRKLTWIRSEWDKQMQRKGAKGSEGVKCTIPKAKDLGPLALWDFSKAYSSRWRPPWMSSGEHNVNVAAHVTRELRDRVAGLQYFSMFELLPGEGQARNRPQSGVTWVDPEKKPQYRTLPRTMENWHMGFGIMCAILYEEAPYHLDGIFAYQQEIQKLHDRHKGDGWCHYDEQFRRHKEVNPAADWAWIHTGLMHEAMNRPVSQPFGFGPSVGGADRIRKGDDGKGICYLFEKGQCGSSERCRYQHICRSCGGGHSKHNCKRQQGDRRPWWDKPRSSGPRPNEETRKGIPPKTRERQVSEAGCALRVGQEMKGFLLLLLWMNCGRRWFTSPMQNKLHS